MCCSFVKAAVERKQRELVSLTAPDLYELFFSMAGYEENPAESSPKALSAAFKF